jgi:hypothetical protein
LSTSWFRVFLIILFLLQDAGGQALPIIGLSKKSDRKIIRNYLKLHKNFSRQFCRAGVEPEFWKRFRNFRGRGYYIPTKLDGKLDRLTINRFIPELVKKEKWIQGQIDFLKGKKNLKYLKKEIEKLDSEFKEILKLKQVHFESKKGTLKRRALNQSKYRFLNYKTKFLKFLEKVPFLLSYRFPVDHFELRQNYDRYKSRKDEDGRRKSNEVYFYRKIVQDGAQNPNNSGSDTFSRANLDTITIHLNKIQEILSENLRFDINSAISSFKQQVRRGKNGQLKRFKEWRSRTREAINFYESLKKNQVKINGKLQTGEDIAKLRVRTRASLKAWVLKKQAEVYKYWTHQPELMRSLYSIETILFNEVGGLDGRDALERKDVTQVVINRTEIPFYSTIEPNDSIHQYLSLDKLKKLDKNKWLNVMFKEGEFSFTYFFITGNVKIFCPDQTRNGRFLRRENLRIALKLLRKPNREFKGVRYFSRASMLGRIDMTPIWNDFHPLPQKPGRLAKNNKKLKKIYQHQKYSYLYNFKDPLGKAYKVVEIKEKIYVMPLEVERFYKYRSPHFFRYFSPKEHLESN